MKADDSFCQISTFCSKRSRNLSLEVAWAQNELLQFLALISDLELYENILLESIVIAWALDAPCFSAGIFTFIYIHARWHHWFW
jgi:hypothetical protein